MKTLSMLELKNKIEHPTKNEIILDVRSQEEFLEGHLKGAKNIPHDEVLNYVDELKQYSAVFVHCHAGGRAQMAFMNLAKAGLNNMVCVAGSGMKDWIEAGLPTEK